MSPGGGRAVRVLLVDDHALVRGALAGLLDAEPDLTVVGAAANGAEAVTLVTADPPDVVLMDLSMPVLDGVEATRQILARAPDVQVLVLTTFSDRTRVADALAAGAIGYLLKDAEPADVVAGVRAAARGESPLDARVARVLISGANRPDPAAGLSSREQEVLRLVARGMANKQVARALGITERTVKVHLGNVFRRIGVSDRTSAALWARDHLTLESPE
jgi:DNA-binding NarL/FixJ family response regulator